jgi:type VI secretion system protein ImpE
VVSDSRRLAGFEQSEFEFLETCMTPTEFFQAGQLQEAVAAAIEDVKKHPTDASKRAFLAELFCFAGDLERADKQLETIAYQEPKAITILALRQVLRAEKCRQEFYKDGRVPEFLGEPTETLKRVLQASIHVREGQLQEAAALLAEAEELRPRTPGVCDGEPFDDLRDVDDLTAGFFEVLTSTGKYFWIPTERIELIEFHKPEFARDLLWRRAHMVVKDGPDGEIFLPTVYAGTLADGDDGLKLGRSTTWRGEEDQPIRGLGQRVLLVGDHDRSILELTEITFDSPVGDGSDDE